MPQEAEWMYSYFKLKCRQQEWGISIAETQKEGEVLLGCVTELEIVTCNGSLDTWDQVLLAFSGNIGCEVSVLHHISAEMFTPPWAF